MKKVFILIIILGCFSGWLKAAPANLPSPNPAFNVQLTINLHSKKSECQTGFGFCNISIVITYELDKSVSGNPPEVKAEAMLGKGGELILKFKETDLMKYDHGTSMTYFKGKKSVPVDASYTVSEEVKKALGSPQPLVIRPGEYKVEFDGSSYSIIIPQ
ncbi:MAG: hypothetical protein Q8867_08655 [Bacteroidota bacterium]|nr:hypothetical protein [Bacteroidota bacterium]